ncbi:MAG: hypothetical protein ACK5KU_05140 [Beutenbergiaceae bacterium]
MPQRLRPTVITLIAVDAVLIAILIALMLTNPRTSEAGEQPETPTAPEGSVTTPLAQETGTDGSRQAVTAPADALAIAAFASPSGNIWCNIGVESVECQIGSMSYQPPTVEGCEGNELLGYIVRVTVDGPEYPCPSGNISGGPAADRTTLAYGETSAVGDFMCTSSESGMTCTNLSSGGQFSIARAGVNFS